MKDDLGNERTTKGEILHVEGVLKCTTYTGKSSAKEGTSGSEVRVVLLTTRNICPLVVGMSLC